MAEVICPTLEHILNADQCNENLAGLGEVVYVGVKADLAAPLTATDNVYSEPSFKAGKGLFKIECADETQGITGGSLGYRKGFKQTLEFAIDAVNKIIAKTGRALNNLDLFFIVPDGEEFQIMYDPNRKCKADADGIQSNTGKAAADERQTTCTFTLQPVKYSNFYVEITDINKLLEGYEAA
jgi:hypothetical protein